MNFDKNTVESLSKKLVIILTYSAKNSTDVEFENTKSLVNYFCVEKRIAEIDIALFQINEDAVILKSQKIMEKQFPLIYFINHRRFVGFHELSSTKLEEFLTPSERASSDAISSLTSFFRGCIFIDKPTLGEALKFIQRARVESGNTNVAVGDISLASKIVENSLWGIRWGVDYASKAIATYIPSQSNEEVLTFRTEEINGIQFTDITVLRQNWYGRTQKRTYRFYSDRFERIDPQGSPTGGELVKATFLYTEIDEIQLENSQKLSVTFKENKHTTQWIESLDANKIIALIKSHLPLHSTVKIVRNLEIKLKKNNLYTIKILAPSGTIKSYPRWSKDGLSIAYEDLNGWRSIDLENIDVDSKEEWWAYDLVHFTENYMSNKIISPVGVSSKGNQKILTTEQVAKDYYDYTFTNTEYIDAKGIRTQQMGYIAEMMDTAGAACSLFVSKSNDFHEGVWKLKNLKLRIFETKCGNPVISPDGKYVAFQEPTSPAIIIYKLEELPQPNYKMLQAEEIHDPETVQYDPKKQPKKVLPPAKIPSHIPTILHAVVQQQEEPKKEKKAVLA